MAQKSRKELVLEAAEKVHRKMRFESLSMQSLLQELDTKTLYKIETQARERLSYLTGVFAPALVPDELSEISILERKLELIDRIKKALK